MKNVLILFAHPRYENSRANRALLTRVADLEYVTLHDLYETYPDFNINICKEKRLLLSHDIIVWHFPLYMYSAPAMLKHWQELVLEHGWAHGAEGDKLKNRLVFCAVTTGGTRESYTRSGFNGHAIGEFLLPFQQAASLCGMNWLPPFMVQGTFLLSDQMLAGCAAHYRLLLHRLADNDLSVEDLRGYEFSNDWLTDAGRREKP